MERLEQIKAALASRRILVTGGSGFIGGRLIEKLSTEHQVKVRVLVRDFSRACRIARFPIEFIHGDVTDAEAVARAAQGCEIIFHCAYGNSGDADWQRAVNFQGTKNILEAASQSRARRVVHLSTALVYGDTPDGDLDERASKRYLGDVYADSKLDAEKVIADYWESRRLPVTVLQPTVVFGPYAPVWTEYVLQQLKTGKLILINGGDGLCNAVYVDDLVDAMMLAATNPRAPGQSFLIAAARPVTWKEFYGRFEDMLGVSATVNMSADEARAFYETTHGKKKKPSLAAESWRLLWREPQVRGRLLETREAALLLGLGRRLVPASVRHSLKNVLRERNGLARPEQTQKDTKTVHAIDPLMIRLYQSKTTIRIDKARSMLGYQPGFSFEAGMRLTMRWARWSNLLDGESTAPSLLVNG